MSVDEVHQCTTLYGRYRNMRIVSEKMLKSPGWVRHCLETAGVRILGRDEASRRPQRKQKRILEQQEVIDRCVELREQGLLIRQIAADVGRGAAWVRSHCRGVPRGTEHIDEGPHCSRCGILVKYAGPMGEDGMCRWCENLQANPSPELSMIEAAVWAVGILHGGSDWNVDLDWLSTPLAHSIATNLGVDMEVYDRRLNLAMLDRLP